MSRPVKTHEEEVEFIRRFGEIIQNNNSLKDKYVISFANIAGVSQFFITDQAGRNLDVIKLMSRQEYSQYIDLLNWWKR